MSNPKMRVENAAQLAGMLAGRILNLKIDAATLAETIEEAIKYRIRTPHDGGATGPVVLAGPSCDSVDTLYEKTDLHLPLALEPGDKVLILSPGAYPSAYSSVGFNGFPPLKTVCI